MIILDFGNGSVCLNDRKIVEHMIDALARADKERYCIIKWQLFNHIPPRIPLRWDVFDHAYDYAQRKGFETTASVFDYDSLRKLLNYETPFIKIPNQKQLRYLIKDIPEPKPIVISWDNNNPLQDKLTWGPFKMHDSLCCISKYPAKNEDYEKAFSPSQMAWGISDHTDNIELFKKHNPDIYEKHFIIPEIQGRYLPMSEFKDLPGVDKERPYCATPETVKELLKAKDE